MRVALSLSACGLVLLAALECRAEVECLGISSDGKHAVLLEHGVRDGSGFPWARATVLEAARNVTVGKPFEVTLDGAAATDAAAVEQVKRAFEAARAALTVGPLRACREIAHDEKGGLTERSGVPIGTVQITTRKARRTEAANPCAAPFSPLLLSVKLYWMDDDRPANLLLDKKVPKDRACLSGCVLGKVFTEGTTGLFVLQCGAPGFEGPGTRSVPIAVKLLYGMDEDLPGSDAKPSQ